MTGSNPDYHEYAKSHVASRVEFCIFQHLGELRIVSRETWRHRHGRAYWKNDINTIHNTQHDISSLCLMISVACKH
jgi:hypothetical protein